MMKKIFYLALLFCVFGAQAQTETMEPTVKYEGNGSIYLENGETIKGTLRFYASRPTKVFFIEEGSDEKDKLKIDEIKGFDIEDKIWSKVISKGSIGGNMYFMQRLTPENRDLGVFLYEQQNTLGNESGFLVTREYYVKKSDWDEAYTVGHLKFTPFHKKGPKVFADCSELAKKIGNKHSDYKMGLMTSDNMKAGIYMKISEEYQDCK